jgi:acyl-CoA synthetase (AMP-forming)/AMP-acid ligase II
MPLDGAPLAVPSHHLDTVLRVGLHHGPDEVAVASLEDEMTWRQLDEAADRLAAGYRALGVAPGDRLASLMPNRTALLVHYLACFKAGIVTTPLNYRYTPAEIDHALVVSGATLLLVHAERADDVATATRVAGLPLGTVTYGATEGVADPSSASVPFEELAARAPVDLGAPDPAAPAAIFFTSGSTGPAKGVTHTLEALTFHAASAAAALEMTRDDVFLPASSISHIGGFVWTFSALWTGARAIVARTFDAKEVLALLRRHRPTILSMIPAALTAVVRDHDTTRADFESLRVCRSGADHVSKELEDEFDALVGLIIDEGYGMTETGIAASNPVSGVIKEGSIGQATPGVSLSVRGDDGDEVAIGTVGRVWIKTPGHTIGYWENAEATAEIMSEGWLDSGDLARADEDGYLWFFGRKKQIIVHDGSNISPLEVESALDEHPSVALAGVVGIHDPVHGENVRAYVVLKETAPPTTSQDLIDFARARVGYKAPEEVVFLDAMPLNPTGKLDRVALGHLAEQHANPHLAAS